jgi:hypothetical protein
VKSKKSCIIFYPNEIFMQGLSRQNNILFVHQWTVQCLFRGLCACPISEVLTCFIWSYSVIKYIMARTYFTLTHIYLKLCLLDDNLKCSYFQTLQNFMFSMLKDSSNSKAAKMSVVCIQLLLYLFMLNPVLWKF